MEAPEPMLKALVWKEWRTQRPLVLAGLATSAVLPSFLMIGAKVSAPDRAVEDFLAIVPFALVLFVWPLFSVCIGTLAIAADMSDGSLRFLLSRPVSRPRVWLVKVATALLALLAVIIGSMVIGAILSFVVAGGDVDVMAYLAPRATTFPWEEIATLSVALALLFGCSVYWSMFVRRPLSGALAGFLTAAGIAFTVGSVWISALPMSARARAATAPVGLATSIVLATAAIWIAAFWIFWRGDIFGAAPRKRAFRPLLTITLVVMLIGAMPAAWVGMRSMSATAAGMYGQLDLIDGSVVLSEKTASGLTTKITSLSIANGERRALVGRHAVLPAISPDRAWMVYLSFNGYLGSLSAGFELRARRTDGSEDFAITADIPWEWPRSWALQFAPDSDHVVLSYGPQQVVIASVLERTSTLHNLSRGAPSEIIGWSTGDEPELLYSQRRTRPRLTTTISALDPGTGDSRLVAEFPEAHLFRMRGTGFRSRRDRPRQPEAGLRWVPGWSSYPDDKPHMYLIDLENPELIELSDSPCRYWGFSDDGRRFIYGNCTGDLRTHDARTEIRIRDLETGADEQFALFEGYENHWFGSQLFLSPDGESVLLFSRQGYGAPRATFVVPRGGAVREIARTRWPLRWLGNTEVLLGYTSPELELELQVVNVVTGSARTIFP